VNFARRTGTPCAKPHALGASKSKTIATVIVPPLIAEFSPPFCWPLPASPVKQAPLLFTAFGNRFWSQGWNQPTAALPR